MSATSGTESESESVRPEFPRKLSEHTDPSFPHKMSPRASRSPEPEYQDTEDVPEQFFLRTAPHPSTKQTSASRFTSYYLRHAGQGSNSVILALNPPKFLYGQMAETAEDGDDGVSEKSGTTGRTGTTKHSERSIGRYSEHGGSAIGPLAGEGGKLLFKSWKRKDKGREWKLHLSGLSEFGKGSKRGNRDMWAPVEIREVKEDEEEDEGDEGFSWALHKNGVDEVLVHKAVKGFIVCEWALGYPQLFYLTDAFQEGRLPEFVQKVLVVREDFEVELDD